MATSLNPTDSADSHSAQGQRSNWIGGPRSPAAARYRPARTRDDLEVDDPSDSFPNRSFVLSMLAEHFTGGSGTQAHSTDRASRRWALDPETEERWGELLQTGRQSSTPHLPASASASASSSPIDSRWQFFGPRQPRRAPRASPSTPTTPFTPFTPYTPDTPELETPKTRQKTSESDSDDASSLHGLEFKITPFLLWEPSVSSSDRNHAHIAVQMDGADASFGPEHRPAAIPPLRPLRADYRRQAVGSQDSVSPTLSAPSSPSSPSSPKSERAQIGSPKQSSRPRLSIVTSSSWSRTSASSRDIQAPSEPIPLPNVVPKSTPSELARLTEMLAADILQVKEKYKAFLAYRGDQAQQVLDCLQLVLDSPSLRNPDRAVILRALTRLSTSSGLYPRCFKLQGIEMLGSEPIDEGRYGDVWKGISHGQLVCAKILRSYQRMPTQPLFKNLSREALLWGQLSHPNILPFYGIHINELKRNRFGLVSPWMENGNVVNYLKHNPNASRIILIHDIASGLQYLHSLDIVHGDIKGTNILVTSAGRACLADFGLSTLLGDNILVWPSLGSEPARSGGTTRWRGPELFLQDSQGEDSIPTPSSDVYSFACTAYEVLTGRIPFYEIKSEGAIILTKLSDSHPNPSRPLPKDAGEELTDELWRLLEDCWNYEPNDRPSLNEVLRRLEEMMTPAGGQLPGDAALSSSRFRKSFNDDDKPSDQDLLDVIAMVSSLHV
ncbi:hypothetical protein D9756_008335 [Leucocoprinus leucothites]|uniref:Protein kinase domain-containing protein n=1 Tax=Leucocoprinus leucothites TaxID=201217 RepID=A0A8H5D023_9AGAR|nr:hypothetical protein D9756_008335 [Leucoagaricus leucothites]